MTTNYSIQDFDSLPEASLNNAQVSSSKNNDAFNFDFNELFNDIHANHIEASQSNANNMEQSLLSHFVGDLTPATAAVVAAESPMMDTPFLDSSCMNTPFTPASVFTPAMSQFQNSPYYSPYIESSLGSQSTLNQRDDDLVSNYLKNDMPWQTTSTPAVSATDLFGQTPVLHSTPAIASSDLLNTLNCDPSQLLLSSNNNNNTSNGESSDFLFPPLPSDNQQASSPAALDTNTTQDIDISSLLEDTFDESFFDLIETQQPTVVQQPAEELASNPLKRKNTTTEPDCSSKRAKITATNPADSSKRPFKCTRCDAAFSRRFNLGTHMKTHDRMRTKENPCLLCSKSFDRKHDLTRHISTVHNGVRAFACEQCSSTFSRKDALVRHCLKKHSSSS